MTLEELAEKHMIQFRTALPGADVFSDMGQISIEYAISVLEDVRQELVNKFMTKSAKTIEDKIQELKKLL